MEKQTDPPSQSMMVTNTPPPRTLRPAASQPAVIDDSNSVLRTTNNAAPVEKGHWDVVIGIVLVIVLVALYIMLIYNSPENKALRAITQATTDCNTAIASKSDADYAVADVSIANANTLYNAAVATYAAGAPLSSALDAAGKALHGLACQFRTVSTAKLAFSNRYGLTGKGIAIPQTGNRKRAY